MSALRITDSPTDAEMAAAFELRHRVFVIGQNVPPELEVDGLDPEARHVVVFEGERAVATGRVRLGVDPDGVVAKAERIAVDDACRGRGLGRLVMDRIERIARGAGCTTLKLASQVDAVPFYERLSYRPYGDLFVDAGIDHRWMDKPL